MFSLTTIHLLRAEQMKFVSTRSSAAAVTFAEAFAAGLAPDGGLYVPEELPQIVPELLAADQLSYADLAFRFLSAFDTTHDPAVLRAIVDRSYSTFDDNTNPAPLIGLADKLSVLELFHGPTLAFKDFGLQLVGNLFEDQIANTGRSINVLGATSGDTGSAAIHGLADKSGVNVFILYPDGRISPMQERQMTCTGASNIYPIAITGSFDDAQRIVKDLFGDLDFKAAQHLSAVNSINLARVLAQAIYYIWAARQLPAAERATASYIVPTGNFGNVFAGWLAKQMGLPMGKLSIATNQNDILHRLFTTGRYKVGAVQPSLAPSMDIQVASNFERFLYFHLGQDGARTTELMAQVRSGEPLDLPDFDAGAFHATRADDVEIRELIASAHREYGYVADPHTACGFKGLGELPGHRVILSTASPAKFPDTIRETIEFEPTHPSLEEAKTKTPMRHELPAD
ncbi:MAG: threonine synthase, partial [Verrucomicrobiales bacterium]